MPKKKGTVPVLAPEYEDEIPVANKVTIAPHTDHERTILLRVPRGREARKKTAQLLPSLTNIDAFKDTDGRKEMSFADIIKMIEQFWKFEEFEEVLLPFALQLEEDLDYLEELTLMEAFEAFMKAAMYIVSGGATEEAREALKKSGGEDERAAEAE